jgi:ribosomal protein S18 acetylase RimI-like enzyme
MNPSNPTDQIVPADPADTIPLACLIAEAFHDLAPSQWLVPDDEARREIFTGYFQMYVEDAFAHGEVHTNSDLSAVALWIHNSGAAHAPASDYEAKLDALTGVFAPRFRVFDRELDAHHPTGTPHHHLAILAVHPKHQRHGMGTAMLDHHHSAIASAGVPTYLEASDLGTRGLYIRHGYEDYGVPISLPDGPDMYPMWRPIREN